MDNPRFRILDFSQKKKVHKNSRKILTVIRNTVEDGLNPPLLSGPTASFDCLIASEILLFYKDTEDYEFSCLLDFFQVSNDYFVTFLAVTVTLVPDCVKQYQSESFGPRLLLLLSAILFQSEHPLSASGWLPK